MIPYFARTFLDDGAQYPSTTRACGDHPAINITSSLRLNRLNLLTMWLTRSKTQPLCVTLDMKPFGHAAPECKMAAIVAITHLTAHAPRWESLYLSLPGEMFSVFCATLSVSAAPLILRTARITLGNWTATSDNIAAVQSFIARAPALEELEWNNRPHWDGWDAPFSSGIEKLFAGGGWEHITRLVFDTFLTTENILALLSKATSLTHLDVKRFGSLPRDNDTVYFTEKSHAPAIAPALRTLKIYQHTLDDALRRLLDGIISPDLVELSVACGFPPEDGQTAHAMGISLAQFVSQTKLEVLALEGTGISGESLIVCLSAAPGLRSLMIRAARGAAVINDEVLEALNVASCKKAEQELLCPKLRDIVLHKAVECTNGALANMVRTRLGDVSLAYASEGGLTGHVRQIEVVFTRQQNITNTSDIAYFKSLYTTISYVDNTPRTF